MAGSREETHQVFGHWRNIRRFGRNIRKDKESYYD
jgi:hypothetical protein